MGLHEAHGGLRPLFNKSNSSQRVELLIPAGAEVCVPADVAAQLPVEFVPVGDTTKADQAAEREAAAAASEAPTVADEAPADPPAPAKKAAKKAAPTAAKTSNK